MFENVGSARAMRACVVLFSLLAACASTEIAGAPGSAFAVQSVQKATPQFAAEREVQAGESGWFESEQESQGAWPSIGFDEPVPQKDCCKICRKGCACGDTCISCSKTCRVGPGCACDG